MTLKEGWAGIVVASAMVARPRDSLEKKGRPHRDQYTGKDSIMGTMRHVASPIAKSFSEALRIDTEAGSWIFIAGQVGVAIPPVTH